MIQDFDWIFLCVLAITAFTGFSLYELRAIHLALAKKQ